MLSLSDVHAPGDFKALYEANGLETPEARLAYLQGQLPAGLRITFARNTPAAASVEKLERFFLGNAWAGKSGQVNGTGNGTDVAPKEGC